MQCWTRVTVIAALALLLLIGLPHAFAVSRQDAATAIAEAGYALQAAFLNVSDAEGAGVNVTGLLSRLNDAGVTLNMAKADANDGNYSNAVSEAAACQAVADSVANDAVALKSEAAGRLSSLLLTFVFGSVGAGLFLVMLLLAWLWFRRYFGKKLLESRPEVAS